MYFLIIISRLRPRRRDPLPHARSSPASHRAANSASNLSRRAWQRFGVLASVLGWMSGDFRTRTRPRTRRLSPLRRSLFLGTRFYVFFYFAKPREISLVLPLVVAHTYINKVSVVCVCSSQAPFRCDITMTVLTTFRSKFQILRNFA